MIKQPKIHMGRRFKDDDGNWVNSTYCNRRRRTVSVEVDGEKVERSNATTKWYKVTCQICKDRKGKYASNKGS